MVRLAKSLPKPIYRPKPKVEPVLPEVVNQEAQLALLRSIDEKLTKEPEEKEEVEEVKITEPIEVNVLNFPEQKECKYEIKECVHKEVVVNVPDEVYVGNLPEVQKVELDALPLPDGAASSKNQETIKQTLVKIDETLKKLKFDGDSLKTTGSGQVIGGGRGSLLPNNASTATNQDLEIAALNSIITALGGVLDTRELTFVTDKVDVSGSEILLGASSGVGSGQTNVTTAGTEVPIASSTPCVSVTIKAKRTNTGNIYVGVNGVTSTTGFILERGASVTLSIDNLSKVYIDSDVDSEGVSYIYVTA